MRHDRQSPFTRFLSLENPQAPPAAQQCGTPRSPSTLPRQGSPGCPEPAEGSGAAAPPPCGGGSARPGPARGPAPAVTHSRLPAAKARPRHLPRTASACPLRIYPHFPSPAPPDTAQSATLPCATLPPAPSGTPLHPARQRPPRPARSCPAHPARLPPSEPPIPPGALTSVALSDER